MGRYLSSRPDDDDSSGFNIEDLDLDELSLIAAFLGHTKLGRGVSPYRDAAFTLIKKIEEMLGDDFLSDACDDVDLQIAIQDSAGNMIERVSAVNVEFEV